MYQDETLRNEGIPLFSLSFFLSYGGSVMILTLLTEATRRLGVPIFACVSASRGIYSSRSDLPDMVYTLIFPIRTHGHMVHDCSCLI